MSRVTLASIQSLTFYEDSVTRSRRGKPIPQLTCRGKPCSSYKPDVVRCFNAGGTGQDVDWKCEADLPESLRLGRVEVSCEGWSGPGDSYVYKESCGLDYRLVEIPRGMRNPDWEPFSSRQRWDFGSLLFYALWFAILFFVLYKFFQSCFGRRTHPSGSLGSGPSSGGNPSPGWFPGDYQDDRGPPPPYSKNTYPSSTQGGGSGLGFFTGAALGALGTALFNRQGNDRGARQYDWEREHPAGYRPGRGSASARPAARQWDDDDRGEGSSNLGSMRRSTGFGGSNVR